MKAGIIGMGVVGQAQSRLFAAHEQVTYDPALDRLYPWSALRHCDFAVICVGTPAKPDGSCDLSQVARAFEDLPPLLPAIIRSTVPPATTARIACARPGETVHVPEFLHERPGGEWKESADVPFLILGGTPVARAFFKPFLSAVHPGVIHECYATEAELIKYTANLFSAVKVTFANEMARICAAHEMDWERVRAGWLENPGISPAYTSMEGFPPGFSGACWPKDLSALIHASSDAGYEPEFLHAVEEANARFRQQA